MSALDMNARRPNVWVHSTPTDLALDLHVIAEDEPMRDTTNRKPEDARPEVELLHPGDVHLEDLFDCEVSRSHGQSFLAGRSWPRR